MFNIRKSIAVVALLAITQTAMAQEVVSLQDAIQHALKYKSEAVKARLDVQNGKYQIEEARANALPQINGSAGITYNAILQQMALNMGGQTTVIQMGLPWQAQAAVQLDQQIFNMAVFTGLKAAKSTSEFYVINEQLTEEQIVANVATSYFDLYKTKSQLTTIDQTLANTTRVRNILKSLFETGLAKKIDLDRMNVAVNNITSSKQQLINALALQENALKYLIGMDISKPIALPESEFIVDVNAYMEKPIIDVSNRTEIRLLEKQNQLLAFNRQAINAARYPSLSATANYGYLGLGDNFPLFAGKDNGVNWSDFSAISLNLRVPIFSGFANRARTRKAQIEIDRLNVDIADTRLALQLDAENAYTQIRNAIITLSSQEANQQLAKDVLANVENNYKNGLATLTDLLDAETSYADAQNSYTNALVDFKLAEVQLAKAQGKLLTEYASFEK